MPPTITLATQAIRTAIPRYRGANMPIAATNGKRRLSALFQCDDAIAAMQLKVPVDNQNAAGPCVRTEVKFRGPAVRERLARRVIDKSGPLITQAAQYVPNPLCRPIGKRNARARNVSRTSIGGDAFVLFSPRRLALGDPCQHACKQIDA